MLKQQKLHKLIELLILKGEAISLEGLKHCNKKYHSSYDKPIKLGPAYEMQPQVDDIEKKQMYTTFWKQIEGIQVKKPGKLEKLHCSKKNYIGMIETSWYTALLDFFMHL